MENSVFVQDSTDGFMTARQMVFAFEPFGAFERILLSQCHHLAFHGRRGLMRTGQGDTGQFIQSGQPFLLIPPHPFAYGLGGRVKQLRRWLDAVLFGMPDHPQP